MSTVDYGDYTITTTINPSGSRTDTVTWKPGTAGDLAIIADANAASLATKAANALAANQTYLGIAAPTTAQAVAQVAALTRQVNALIRLVARILDSTAGT